MSADKPPVAIIMGSRSDWPTMEHAAKALDDLGVPHGTSTPGIHETNAHIERRNRTILGGTRTVFEHASRRFFLAINTEI
jgi:phosphoribosylcarboxyaminoimidazole (NCAIR) mutase